MSWASDASPDIVMVVLHIWCYIREWLHKGRHVGLSAGCSDDMECSWKDVLYILVIKEVSRLYWVYGEQTVRDCDEKVYSKTHRLIPKFRAPGRSV